MPNDDPEILAAVRRYVLPDRRYMKLHGWNIRHMEDRRRETFGKSLTKAASQVTDAELIPLLKSDWRARLVAAWLITLGGREHYRSLLKKFLLEHEGSNDLKGFCFTLTQFGTHIDAEILSRYLTESLSPSHPLTAQEWALGGLLHLDARLSTSYATEFTGKDGLWARWANVEPGPDTKNLIDYLSSFSYAHKTRTDDQREGDAGDRLVAYSSWRSRRLPASWQILTSETARVKIDSCVDEQLGDCRLVHTEPLSVATCQTCQSVLFSANSIAGAWGIATTNGRTDKRIEMFQSYAELWESLTHHAC
ncbi:DUF6000 family protein [Streptomyces noursei]|uniref:DUF6000 family protein n=1 Tax=Streptomyces noursei TaxID=1971 RepID=UPI0033332821